MARQDDIDNRADQLNPNNDAYWQSRGEDERPDDREEQVKAEKEEEEKAGNLLLTQSLNVPLNAGWEYDDERDD